MQLHPKTLQLPGGFLAAAVKAGVKKDATQYDMALLFSQEPATCAATFTTNQIKAAPVKLSQPRAAKGKACAILVNAGNANACTGPQGMRDAKAMSARTAEATGVPDAQILVCSTGTIGKPMPMDKVLAGVDALCGSLTPDNAEAWHTVEAIMTTDTRPKAVTAEVKIGGKTVRISGMTKGAGMIEPNMATMLCFLLTDAKVAPALLRRLLRSAVDASFNTISVDGDTSTNDSVMMLANGASGAEIKAGSAAEKAFAKALNAVTLYLAHEIVRDGEGVTKFITLKVTGARSDREADTAARFIANSFLVKTGWAGTYPVDGRMLDAIGYSPAKIVEEKVSLWYDDMRVMKNGMRTKDGHSNYLQVTQKPEYTIRVDLGLGKGSAVLYTCDCTEEYVTINRF
jgi:glutamate N-acetyltransferase / amino-acid N-acetyltransferase